MLCSLTVLRSGVLQMAMAIHLSIAFSNQIERLKWLVYILIFFLISHCISISVGRGVASGQGWNILVYIINLSFWNIKLGTCIFGEKMMTSCYEWSYPIKTIYFLVNGKMTFLSVYLYDWWMRDFETWTWSCSLLTHRGCPWWCWRPRLHQLWKQGFLSLFSPDQMMPSCFIQDIYLICKL